MCGCLAILLFRVIMKALIELSMYHDHMLRRIGSMKGHSCVVICYFHSCQFNLTSIVHQFIMVSMFFHQMTGGLHFIFTVVIINELLRPVVPVQRSLARCLRPPWPWISSYTRPSRKIIHSHDAPHSS